jgi:hypothetical protein
METLLPVGRLIQGHPLEKQTTDMEGRPLRNKDGSPRIEYFIRVAIPKTDPEINQKIAEIQQTGVQLWPNGEHQLPTFAWKFKDGDAPPDNTKEGFAGHWVFKCTNGFPVQCVTAGGASEIVDPKQIKRGYYCRVYISVASNKSDSKPGIHLNMLLYEQVAYGEEIKGGPDAQEVFGATPVTQLPPGASTTPLAPAATPVPAGPANPGTQTPPVTPALGFLNPTPDQTIPSYIDGGGGPGAFTMYPGTPAQAGPIPTPAPAVPTVPGPGQGSTIPAKVMTAKANGMSYEQFTAQGWTDKQLIEHGYMVDNVPF